MNPGTRRAIAYIAGRACGASDAEGVLDLQTGEHVSFEGRVGDDIAIYDHSRNCLLGGPASELLDGGTHTRINLELSEGSFTGFDHESNHHFGGRVVGQDVWVFDCEADREFSYAISTLPKDDPEGELHPQ